LLKGLAMNRIARLCLLLILAQPLAGCALFPFAAEWADCHSHQPAGDPNVARAAGACGDTPDTRIGAVSVATP
jgi:hypothetical protein